MPLYEQLAGIAALAVLTAGLAGWVQALGRWRAGHPLVPLSERDPVPWSILDLLVVILAYMATFVCSDYWIRGNEPFNPANATAEDLWAFFVAQGLTNALSIPIAIVITRFRIGTRILVTLRRIWNELTGAEPDGSTLVLGARLSPATVHDWGFSIRRLGSDVVIGCIAFCMLAPPVLAIQAVLTQWFPYEHPLIVALHEHMTSSLFFVGVIVAVVVAPPSEEFFFRVLLQGWLERVAVRKHLPPLVPADGYFQSPSSMPAVPFVTAELASEAAKPYATPQLDAAAGAEEKAVMDSPPRWPIFVSAAIFALMHAGNGPDPIPLFFLALGLGYLYRQTHRITPSMTVHFLLNAASMTLLWMELTFGGK
jgi:membrane protease YdiL (CAAX protease family)